MLKKFLFAIGIISAVLLIWQTNTTYFRKSRKSLEFSSIRLKLCGEKDKCLNVYRGSSNKEVGVKNCESASLFNVINGFIYSVKGCITINNNTQILNAVKPKVGPCATYKILGESTYYMQVGRTNLTLSMIGGGKTETGEIIGAKSDTTAICLENLES
jgi:hypothetical protein